MEQFWTLALTLKTINDTNGLVSLT